MLQNAVAVRRTRRVGDGESTSRTGIGTVLEVASTSTDLRVAGRKAEINMHGFANPGKDRKETDCLAVEAKTGHCRVSLAKGC